jgi:microcystin-dependent protein
VTCSGGITSSTLTTGAITGTNVTASGTGTFSGVTCSGGLTVGSIFNPNFSISSAGAANVASVSTGNITSTGTITNVSNNYSITNLGAATFENVTCNSTMLCKSQVTLRASTNTSVMAMDTGLGGTFGIFSRKNGMIINTSTLDLGTIGLSTIVYDSMYTLPLDSSLSSSTVVLPPNDVSKFSPLRFYIYNNHASIIMNVTSTLSNIWGPATGGSTATTSVKIPPSKGISVTLMTTDVGYIQTTSTLQYHYYVMYVNNTNSIDTATTGGTVSVGFNNASIVRIGNASSTTTLSGTVNINDPLNKYVNPPGSIIMFGGTTTPPGYLFCNGASYSTNDYPALFLAIGYNYGGSGTNFNVPNLLWRFPMGPSASNNLNSPEGNVRYGGEFLIRLQQLPDHTHNVAVKWNESNVQGGQSSGRLTDLSTTGGGTATFGSTGIVRSGNQTNYYQPYTVVGYIIKY